MTEEKLKKQAIHRELADLEDKITFYTNQIKRASDFISVYSQEAKDIILQLLKESDNGKTNKI
jgi:hypothetical protein